MTLTLNWCLIIVLFIRVPLGTGISDNLLHQEESKQLHNSQGIGFQLAKVASGFGILCMQGNTFFSATVWKYLSM